MPHSLPVSTCFTCCLMSVRSDLASLHFSSFSGVGVVIVSFSDACVVVSFSDAGVLFMFFVCFVFGACVCVCVCVCV